MKARSIKIKNNSGVRLVFDALYTAQKDSAVWSPIFEGIQQIYTVYNDTTPIESIITGIKPSLLESIIISIACIDGALKNGKTIVEILD